jgi:hypothetical protein
MSSTKTKNWWQSKLVVIGLILVVLGVFLVALDKSELGWTLIAVGTQQAGLRMLTDSEIKPSKPTATLKPKYP